MVEGWLTPSSSCSSSASPGWVDNLDDNIQWRPEERQTSSAWSRDWSPSWCRRWSRSWGRTPGLAPGIVWTWRMTCSLTWPGHTWCWLLTLSCNGMMLADHLHQALVQSSQESNWNRIIIFEGNTQLCRHEKYEYLCRHLNQIFLILLFNIRYSGRYDGPSSCIINLRCPRSHHVYH